MATAGARPAAPDLDPNYDACGKAIGLAALGRADAVPTDGAVAWHTRLWFWMTNDGDRGTTPHAAIVNGNFGGNRPD